MVGTIKIDASSPGDKIEPDFFGLMTEEINHSYDGGLYAELIQNRAFRDDDDKPIHWMHQDWGDWRNTRPQLSPRHTCSPASP
jgi:hypothetical protein